MHLQGQAPEHLGAVDRRRGSSRSPTIAYMFLGLLLPDGHLPCVVRSRGNEDESEAVGAWSRGPLQTLSTTTYIFMRTVGRTLDESHVQLLDRSVVLLLRVWQPMIPALKLLRRDDA